MTNEYIYTSKRKNDECYTERYAVEPLLPYIDRLCRDSLRNLKIWCPFDTEESEFVKVFTEYGYDIVHSHIKNGQDFFEYEPEKWDIMISNPPFTNKRKIFERALSFEKPFALLMNIQWLNDPAPAKVFKGKDLQILSFDERMRFKNQIQRKINFMSAYFCWNFLPQQLIFENFSASGQQKLFKQEETS